MAKIASRRVFRSSGSPIRQVTLGSASTASNAAAFGTKVSELTEFYRQLNDIEALTKLAENDPDGFLSYAKTRMAQLGTSHPDYSIWQGLVDKAQNKITENQWAEKITEDPMQLEKFKDYLTAQLKTSPTGSNAANLLLQSIDKVNKSITARDEGAKDQKALLDYMNNNDENSYIRYLTAKAFRTTDPKLLDQIQSDITNLQARQQKKEVSQRAQERLNAFADFEQGGSAADALARLRALARDPKITDSELSAIQSTISAVVTRAQSRASQAQSSGTKAAALLAKQEVDNADANYTKAFRQIQAKINRGINPSADDFTKLHDAQEILSRTLKEQAGNLPDSLEATARTWVDRSYTLDKDVSALEASSDKLALKNQDISPTGNSEFAKQLAQFQGNDGADINARLKLIDKRLSDLTNSNQKYLTQGARDAVQTQSDNLTAQYNQQINALLKAKAPMGANDQVQLDAAWAAYQTAYKKSPNKFSFKADQTLYNRAAAESSDPQQFEQLVGIKKPDGTFLNNQQGQSLWSELHDLAAGAANGGRPAQYDPNTFQFTGSDEAIQNVKDAENWANQLQNKQGISPTDSMFSALPGYNQNPQFNYNPFGVNDLGPVAYFNPGLGADRALSMLGAPENQSQQRQSQMPDEQQPDMSNIDQSSNNSDWSTQFLDESTRALRRAQSILDQPTELDLNGPSMPNLPDPSPFVDSTDWSSFFDDRWDSGPTMPPGTDAGTPTGYGTSGSGSTSGMGHQ